MPTLSADQERLVNDYLDYARSVAYKISRKLPRNGMLLDRDDITQLAYQGLVEAAHRFDVSRFDPKISDLATNFKSFAYSRIAGAIIDGCRQTSFVRRRGLEKGLYFQMLSIEGATHPDGSQKEWNLPMPQPDPDWQIDLSDAIDKLDQRQRIVITGLAVGASGKELAKTLQVTESRISQIAAEAREKLTASLNPDLGGKLGV